jgi:hypothetical protein
MSDNQTPALPPLRKRSEVGRKPQQQTIAEVVANPPAPPVEVEPAKPNAVGADGMEKISEFVGAVRKAGFDLSLIVAAQWGVEIRNAIRTWLVTKNPATIPAQLVTMKAKASDATAAPLPARVGAEVNLDNLRARLNRFGIHPSIAEMQEWSLVALGVATTWVDGDGKPDELVPWLAKYAATQLPAGVRVANDDEASKILKDAGEEPSKRAKKPIPPPDPDVVRQVPREGNESGSKTDFPGTTRAPAPSAAVPSPPPAMRKEDLPEAWGGPPEHPKPPHVVPVVSESPDFDRLVSTILAEMQIDQEYDELEAALEIGEDRRDYTTLNSEVDKADRRAWRANGLWAQARLVYERMKIDQEEVDADLWRQALTALEEDEKKPKTRIEDVKAKIAEMFPDEFRGGKIRLKTAEIAVDRCESFSKRWSERAQALRVMLQACRK